MSVKYLNYTSICVKNFTWKIVENGCRVCSHLKFNSLCKNNLKVKQQVEAAATLFNLKSSWRNSEEVDFKNLTLFLL